MPEPEKKEEEKPDPEVDPTEVDPAEVEEEVIEEEEDLEAIKAALAKERKERRDAVKRANAATKELDKARDKDLSDAEREKKRADDAEADLEKRTGRIRTANLTLALADHGLVGTRAKAAAKLIEDVDFDDDDEPTNLDEALAAAREAYGDDIFKGGTPAKKKPPRSNAGEGDDDGEKPKVTAEEMQYAKALGMTAEEYAEQRDAVHT